MDVSGTITSSDKSSDTEREITYIPKRGKHTVGPLEIPTVFNSLQPILHIKLENQYKDRGLITVDGFNTRSHGSVCAMERICVDGMCGNVVDTYGGLLPIGSPLACTFNNMFYNSGLGSVTGNEIVWASAESGAFSGQFNIYYIYNEEVYADTLKPTPNNEGIVEVTTSTEYYTSAPNLGQVR